jgi:hypothetical protein
VALLVGLLADARAHPRVSMPLSSRFVTAPLGGHMSRRRRCLMYLLPGDDIDRMTDLAMAKIYGGSPG